MEIQRLLNEQSNMTILALTFSLSPFPLCPSPCTTSLIALFLLPLEPQLANVQLATLNWSATQV